MLALDVGSSSVRAQRFDERGGADGELRQEKYEAWDPAEVAAAVRRVLGDEEPDATSCFAHSLVAVDEGWNALTPILGWRAPAAPTRPDWLAQARPDAVHARTGAFSTRPSGRPSSRGSLRRSPRPSAGRRASSPCRLLAREAETSLGMASTSGLLDLATQEWDAELLDILGIEEERLPRITEAPLWPDAACSNAGAGCMTRERARSWSAPRARSASSESERPQPKPGSSSISRTRAASSRAARSPTAATSTGGSSGRSATRRDRSPSAIRATTV